jgi:TetR/AcrR family transcriptional regulator, transcriptional repressor for nem operon
VADAAQAGEPVRQALADELTAYADGLAALLADPRPRRRQRALATIALMYGGLSLARALRGTPLSDDILQACRDHAREAFSND